MATDFHPHGYPEDFYPGYTPDDYDRMIPMSTVHVIDILAIDPTTNEHGDTYQPTCSCGWNTEEGEVNRGLGALKCGDKNTAQAFGNAHLNWVVKNVAKENES